MLTRSRNYPSLFRGLLTVLIAGSLAGCGPLGAGAYFATRSLGSSGGGGGGTAAPNPNPNPPPPPAPNPNPNPGPPPRPPNVNPIAVNDSYATAGNALLTVGAAAGVLNNDSDPDLSLPLQATAFSGASAQGGVAALASDGSFTYTSAPGFTGADTFSYTLNDSAGGSATGTVTVNVTGTGWYVNNQGLATGIGTQADPFDSLAKAEAASAAGDSIFLLTGDGTTTNHTAGIVLKDNQSLIGQGASAQLGNAGAIGITLANNNTVSGVVVNGANDGISGTGVGGSTLTSVTVINCASGVVFTNATGTHTVSTFTSATTSSGFSVVTSPTATFNVSNLNLGTTTAGFPGASLFLQTGGTVNLSGTNTITATGTYGVQATGTALNVTLATVVATTSPAQGIVLANCTGTFTVTGATTIANNVSLGGIAISGANAPTTTFGVTNVTNRNGFGIEVTAATGAVAFGGTTVTGASASAAVSHQGSGANLSFASLTITNGTEEGILLNGNTGTFTVTGATTIDGPTLACLRVQGAQNAITFNALTLDNRNAEGLLLEATSGTLTFGGPTAVNAPAGGTLAGIRGLNCAATVNFNTSVVVTGSGGHGVELATCTSVFTFNAATIQNSTGDGLRLGATTSTINFPANAAITNTTGSAIRVQGGAPTLNFTGAITNTTSSMLFVNTTTGGAVNLTSGGAGITNTGGGGIFLNGAAGSVTVTDFGITNCTASAIFVSGGSGTFSFVNGTITGGFRALTVQSGSSASSFTGGSFTYAGIQDAVRVVTGHFGSVTFDTTHVMNVTNGTGFQFVDADGTYAFNGTTTLSGGNAGVDITVGSSGAFTFGPNTTITSPTGTAFNVNGSACSVAYSGNLNQATAAPAIQVTNHAVGTLTFQTNTINATNGTGLQFDDADGTYTFNGTTTLNGGDAGIDILNGSAGTFSFGTNTSITSPANSATTGAFNVDSANAPSITYGGSITNTNFLAIRIASMIGGTITFDSAATDAIRCSGAGRGVLIANSTATLNFTADMELNGSGGGIDIDASSGTATFTDTDISGPTLNVFDVTGGTISIDFLFDCTIVNGNNTSLVRVSGGHVTGTLTFLGSISTTAGDGLQFDNANGTYFFNGPTTLNGGDAGIDILGASGGGFFFRTNTQITNPTGIAVRVDAPGSSPQVVYSGTITNNANDVIHIANTVAPNGISFNSFAPGAITDSGAGTGVFLNNTGQNITIGSPMTLNGLEGVDVDGGSSSLGLIDTDISTTGIAVDVNGGTKSVVFHTACRVTVSAANNVAAVNVVNQVGGGVVFQAGSVLLVNNGPGLQFSNADGGYSFLGTTTLNGGDAGIDITSGSTGSFTFAGAMSITNPTGDAVFIDGPGAAASSFTLSYTGAITNNAGRIINIQNTSPLGGGVTFTGAGAGIVDTGGQGIRISDCRGNVTLDTFSVINSTSTGVSLVGGNNNGTFTFTTPTITNPGDHAWIIDDGACDVNVTGGTTSQSNAFLAVGVRNTHAGTVIFDAGHTINASNGSGLEFNNADGSYTFGGTTTLAGGDAGIDILNGSSGTFDFSGNTAITSPTNSLTAGSLNINTATRVVVTYTGTIINTAFHAVRIEGVLAGSVVTLNSSVPDAVQDSVAGHGVLLDNCAGTINFVADMELSGASGGVSVVGGSATITFLDTDVITNIGGYSELFGVVGGSSTINFLPNSSLVNTTSGGPRLVRVSGGHTAGTLTFSGPLTTVVAGPGFAFSAAGGTYAFDGTNTLSGSTGVGIEILGSSGTFSWTAATTITNPQSRAMWVSGGTATVTYAGTISKSSPGDLLRFESITGGSITCSGAITGTMTTGRVEVGNCTGGTISLTGNVSLGTAGSRVTHGVSFLGNTNTTLNIANLTTFTTDYSLQANLNTGGALNVTTGAVNSTSYALLLQTTNCGVALTSTTGWVRLRGISGVLSCGDTTVAAAPQEAIEVANSSATVTFGNAVVSRTVALPTNEGVDLQSNTGALTFASLSIDTSAGNQTALFASSNGTLTISGGASVINAGNGRAVRIINTTLNVALQSVTSSGGTLPGIDLSGASGSFTVTGVGTTAGSGGTIGVKTGADAAFPALPTVGVGVVLVGSRNVTLTNMNLTQFTNYGVYAAGLNNGGAGNTLTLTGCTIDPGAGNVIGDSATELEGAVRIVSSTGEVTINNTTVRQSRTNNVLVEQSSGAMIFGMDGCTIGINDSTTGVDGVQLAASGTSSLTTTIQNTTFSGARVNMVQTNFQDNSSGSVTIRDNTIVSSSQPTVTGVLVFAFTTGNVSCDISGSAPNAQTISGGALGLGFSSISVTFISAGGTPALAATIVNNRIEDRQVRISATGSVSVTLTLSNNSLTKISGIGSGIVLVDLNSSSNANITVTNNTMELRAFGSSVDYGVTIRNRFSATPTQVCLFFTGNTIDLSAGITSKQPFFLRQDDASGQFRIPTYAGALAGEDGVLVGGGGCTNGSASSNTVGLGAFWSGLNTLTPGPSATGLFVDARRTCGILTTGTTCP